MPIGSNYPGMDVENVLAAVVEQLERLAVALLAAAGIAQQLSKISQASGPGMDTASAYHPAQGPAADLRQGPELRIR